MKVIAINGSPRKDGNTAIALKTVCDVLNKNSIETEIINAGAFNIRGCMACGACGDCECAYEEKFFNEAVRKMAEADGILLGSPTYYAGMAGTMKSFLDKAFRTASGHFRLKVGAAVATLRRAGGIETFNQLNNYFLISEMIIAPSFYWNTAHGAAKGEVLQDIEAICTLENLGENMAYLLKMRELTKDTLKMPEKKEHIKFNLVR